MIAFKANQRCLTGAQTRGELECRYVLTSMIESFARVRSAGERLDALASAQTIWELAGYKQITPRQVKGQRASEGGNNRHTQTVQSA